MQPITSQILTSTDKVLKAQVSPWINQEGGHCHITNPLLLFRLDLLWDKGDSLRKDCWNLSCGVKGKTKIKFKK